MAFGFSALSYIIALIVDAFLIFFSLFHVIAFDELKTDYKDPILQCNSLNPVSAPNTVVDFFFKCTISVGATRVFAAPVLQYTVCVVGGMVCVLVQSTTDYLSH